jgi:hypothetical protein
MPPPSDHNFYEAVPPVGWRGRYRRIPGHNSTLYVWSDDTIGCYWQAQSERRKCLALKIPALTDLTLALNHVKRHCAGQPGGSFIINEYGQAICPVKDESFSRYFVGEIKRPIEFVDPDGRSFNLNDDRGLKAGDPWPFPYIGMPYNLSARGRIYFPMRDDVDTECLYPPVQDGQLIARLRAVRGSGGIRFLVNPHGIALTKQADNAGEWTAKYVGRIDYSKWFPKEQP